MMNTEHIAKKLILHGTRTHDANLHRDVAELLFQGECISLIQIKDLTNNVPLNTKYDPELRDIASWHDQHYPGYEHPRHRRHIIYFNNNDFDNRLQCISLFQVIDDLMIVYQRSADVAKMIDDFRFFVEIRNRYFTNVDCIQIVYGSLHVKIENE